MSSPHPLILGTLVSTNGVDESMQNSLPFAEFVTNSLRRYIKKDWGETDPDDHASNDAALNPASPSRILAVYNLPADLINDPLVVNRDGQQEKSIWIVTEWDRSVTTILFPGEY